MLSELLHPVTEGEVRDRNAAGHVVVVCAFAEHGDRLTGEPSA